MESQKKYYYILMMALAMVFWGASWPFSKIMANELHPILVGFLRFLCVGIIFIPFMLIFKIGFKVSMSNFFLLVLASIFNALYSILFFMGLTYGNAGQAGVITTTLSPIFATLISSVMFKVNLSFKEKLGLALGITSGLILINPSSFSNILHPFNMFFIGSALLWAMLTIVIRFIYNTNAMTINFYTSSFSAILLLPSAFILDISEVKNLQANFFIAFFIVSILSTAVATSMFYKGIKVLGVSAGGSFILLVPILALVFSFILLKEVPSVSTILGGALAILAVYLMNFKKTKKTEDSNKNQQ